jgi:hypothetical protein
MLLKTAVGMLQILNELLCSSHLAINLPWALLSLPEHACFLLLFLQPSLDRALKTSLSANTWRAPSRHPLPNRPTNSAPSLSHRPRPVTQDTLAPPQIKSCPFRLDALAARLRQSTSDASGRAHTAPLVKSLPSPHSFPLDPERRNHSLSVRTRPSLSAPVPFFLEFDRRAALASSPSPGR